VVADEQSQKIASEFSGRVQVPKTLLIEPRSSWKNGDIESKAPRRTLDGEIFDTLLEAKVLIEPRRVQHSMI
jgi:hypothetical protein